MDDFRLEHPEVNDVVRRSGAGSHERPNNGATNIWLTPPSFIQYLGPFDLDPCAAPSPRPWPTAHRHIELPADGLALPWAGRVWLNPPYGDEIDAWVRKMALHRYGVALVFARTETDWWVDNIWPVADSVLFIAGRLSFYNCKGAKAEGNAGAPSALIGYTEADTISIQTSGIRGTLVYPGRPYARRIVNG